MVMTPDPTERLLGSLDRPVPPREAFADALLEHLEHVLEGSVEGAADEVTAPALRQQNEPAERFVEAWPTTSTRQR
jgi:hypothetical protein